MATKSVISRASAAEAPVPISRYRAPALEKGLDVIELLAAQKSPLNLSAISHRLGRSSGELFRMLQVLEFKGFITTSGNGPGYVLTNKLFALAMAQAPVRSLVETALPIMRKLALEIGQSCHIAVASEDQIVVITRIERPGDLGFSVRISSVRAATSEYSTIAERPEVGSGEELRRIATTSTPFWRRRSRRRPPMNPLARDPIVTPMGTGVRAIDSLLTCGRGQRVGLFGGSGVGKSTLLGMMARGTSADIAVIALVGERGREVRSFLEHDLGAEGLKRSVVIVSTSDNPPLVRLRAAYAATSVAEYFRARGQHV